MAGEAEPVYRSQFDKNGYYDPGKLSLNAGAPGTEALLRLPDLMQQATARRMEDEKHTDAQLFQYGMEVGNTPFRLALSAFLTQQYGDVVESQDLILTNGASLGLWLILTFLFRRGDTVFVEDPTFNIALTSFRDYGLNIIPVSTDDEGISVIDLERKLKQHCPYCRQCSKDDPKSALLYVIPIFHNPSGRVTSPDRCRRIIKLAREYNLLVVADDVYNLIYFDDDDTPPKRLFAYDNRNDTNYAGNVISNGSFSKFSGPGLRLGWMEAPKWFRDRFENSGPLQSGGGLNIYTSGIMEAAINLGLLEEHVRFLREDLKLKKNVVTQALKENLPPGSKLTQDVKGGYFLWVELPEDIDSEEFRKFTVEHYQVDFAPGKNYSISGNFQNFIRICFSFHSKRLLEIAIPRLCEAIKGYQQLHLKKSKPSHLM